MRIEDNIYFSPSTRLESLDLSNRESVIMHFHERIAGYYFSPVAILNKSSHAFASGAILCLLIDAFARYSTLENRVRIRYVNWCMENMDLDEGTAKDFYEFFRCGLLHESHIKKFGQFSFDGDFNLPISIYSGFLVVNPIYLHSLLNGYLEDFTKKLHEDDSLYDIFIYRMKLDFGDEVDLAKEEKA